MSGAKADAILARTTTMRKKRKADRRRSGEGAKFRQRLVPPEVRGVAKVTGNRNGSRDRSCAYEGRIYLLSTGFTWVVFLSLSHTVLAGYVIGLSIISYISIVFLFFFCTLSLVDTHRQFNSPPALCTCTYVTISLSIVKGRLLVTD